ncbi:MAG: hypothetical protein V4683_14465 [Bacteroidota bacterium]
MSKLTNEEKAEIDRKIRENDLNIYEKRFLLFTKLMRRGMMLNNAEKVHKKID